MRDFDADGLLSGGASQSPEPSTSPCLRDVCFTQDRHPESVYADDGNQNSGETGS